MHLQSVSRTVITTALMSVGLFLFTLSPALAGQFDWTDVDFSSNGGSVEIEINSETHIESSSELSITHNGVEVVSETENVLSHTSVTIEGDEDNIEVVAEVTSAQPTVLGIQTPYTDAVELKRLYLDADTITKGYTVETSGKDFRVGVVDAAVTVPVEVVFKDIPASHLPHEMTDTKVSRIYEYDIRHNVGNGTESLGVLEKNVYVSLKYQGETPNKKVIHFWNKPEQRWVPLPTSTNFDQKTVRATTHFPYARLAVFDVDNIYEGPASWYVSGYYCECAASNTHFRGTRLQVTNITYGSKKNGANMIVRVNDYGPELAVHPDRFIDLDKVSYAMIANSVGSGIMTVRVEVIDPENAKAYEYKEEDGALILANYP